MLLAAVLLMSEAPLPIREGGVGLMIISSAGIGGETYYVECQALL